MASLDSDLAAAALARAARTPIARHRRDKKFLRLSAAGWRAKPIAKRLDAAVGVVGNVVLQNQAARKPRASHADAVNTADVPIEVWQQAMLPKLEKIAKALGARDACARAFVFLSLLQLKPYPDIGVFQTWVHQVTGYDEGEVGLFIERGIRASLIVDGQPNARAFDDAAADGKGIGLMLLVWVLEGKFCRTADGQISLPAGNQEQTCGS